MKVSLRYIISGFLLQLHKINGDDSKFFAQKMTLVQPEDVGYGHAQIIHDLQEAIRKRQPENGIEYLQYLSLTMMDHFCNPSSLECQKNMAQMTTDFIASPQGNATNGFEYMSLYLLPEDFHPDVKLFLEKLFFSVSLLDLNEDPTNLLLLMYEDMEELKYFENVTDEDHRLVGLITYSVGTESTKQWYEILNDENNPFSQMQQLQSRKHGRNMQSTNEGFDFVSLIEADIIGAASGAISTIFGSKSGDILSNALSEATIASSKQAANELIPEVPEITGCLFPDSQLCDANPENGDDDSDCLFPNSPLCGVNFTVPEEGIGCLFPNSTFCDSPPNPENPENPESPENPENPDGEIDDCRFSNTPLCNTTINNLPTIDNLPTINNLPDGENALATFCQRFPNNPLCVN